MRGGVKVYFFSQFDAPLDLELFVERTLLIFLDFSGNFNINLLHMYRSLSGLYSLFHLSVSPVLQDHIQSGTQMNILE